MFSFELTAGQGACSSLVARDWVVWGVGLIFWGGFGIMVGCIVVFLEERAQALQMLRAAKRVSLRFWRPLRTGGVGE